jgi:hypothetical protein
MLYYDFRIFFLIRIVGGGAQTGSIRQVGYLLAYCTCPEWRIWWNEDCQRHFVHQKYHLIRLRVRTRGRSMEQPEFGV